MSTAVAETRRHAWAVIVGIWAASRLMLAGTAAFVARHYHRSFHDVIVSFDGKIYESIARSGYRSLTDFAWPPGVILSIRAALACGVSPQVWGLALSGVCSLLAAFALYRLAGPRYGLFAVAVWCFAPPTVFTFVLYSEAAFCAAAFWAWDRMRHGRWLQMGVLLALACTIRVTGVFLCAGALVWILTSRGGVLQGWAARLKALAFLALPALVLIGFEAYLYVRFHDWLAWYHAQTKGWYRQSANPLQILKFNFQFIQPGAYRYWIGFAWVHRLEFVSLVIAAVVTIALVVRRHWGEAAYVGLQVLALGTSLEITALNRGTLMWWPIWVLLAEALWKRRRDWLVQTVFWVVLIPVSAAWGWLFFNGFWAG